MAGIRPGQPGHGGTSAILRLRPVRIVNGAPQGGWTDHWEIICPACGDDGIGDYRSISPYLQRMRGPYATEYEGSLALARHRGFAAEPAPVAHPVGVGQSRPALPQPALPQPELAEPELAEPLSTA